MSVSRGVYVRSSQLSNYTHPSPRSSCSRHVEFPQMGHGPAKIPLAGEKTIPAICTLFVGLWEIEGVGCETPSSAFRGRMYEKFGRECASVRQAYVQIKRSIGSL